MPKLQGKRNNYRNRKMRKRYKKKLRSCPMCKPHKTHGPKRWKVRDEALLKEFEKGNYDGEK
jgi:hypothetical protein